MVVCILQLHTYSCILKWCIIDVAYFDALAARKTRLGKTYPPVISNCLPEFFDALNESMDGLSQRIYIHCQLIHSTACFPH